MLTWVKSLLGYTDRATSAATRIAVAWEDIAALSEAARDEFRAKLGKEPSPLVLPAPEEKPGKGGRKP